MVRQIIKKIKRKRSKPGQPNGKQRHKKNGVLKIHNQVDIHPENLPEGAVYSVLGQPENYSLRAKKRNKKAYSENFEKAWAHWPRAKADYNENKAKAWQVWQRQMGENGMSEEDLLRAIGRYIRWTKAEGMEVQYTKQMASFLSLQADHVSSDWRPRTKTVVSLSHSDIPPEDLQRELRGPE